VPTGAATHNRDVWLRARLEELAKDVGRLRRGTRETEFDWNVDRIADRVWWLICRDIPTAGDLVNGGYDVPTALAITDTETRRLKTLLGERAAV
jgi:hypothetical protein